MAGRETRIERLESRLGGAEQPILTTRGYQLADPANGSSKHHAEHAVFVPTLDEAADLIERGSLIWMGGTGRRSSLISPGSLRIIRATSGRMKSQAEIKILLEQYATAVWDVLSRSGATARVACWSEPEETGTGGWSCVLRKAGRKVGWEVWLDRYMGGPEHKLYYGIFGGEADVDLTSILFCASNQRLRMTGKDLVTDAGVSQLRSERAAEAIGRYITGPYDSGSWFGRYAASLKSGAEEAAAFFEMVFKSEVRHEAFVEGACGQVTVSRYERDPKARVACLLHYKCVCLVCEMDFESTYGELGKGFIHVHHRTPLESVGKGSFRSYGREKP